MVHFVLVSFLAKLINEAREAFAYKTSLRRSIGQQFKAKVSSQLLVAEENAQYFLFIQN